MDQNEAQSGQGVVNPQGDQPHNNQTMESLLESESLSVELPQVGDPQRHDRKHQLKSNPHQRGGKI